MEIFISFIIGFTITWFFTKPENIIESIEYCPKKETIVRLAEEHRGDKKMMKELKEYSLVRIQQGNYEYVDVLTTLKKKDRNDKS